MIPDGSPGGFLAISVRPGTAAPPVAAVAAAARALGGSAHTWLAEGDLTLVLSGLAAAADPAGGTATLLTRAARQHERVLDLAAASRLVRGGPGPDLAGTLPPFAAMTWGGPGQGLLVGIDPLGFRHLYCRQGTGWAGVSTSARALARCQPAGADRLALGMQSLLGWQVGLRTPFAEVSTLPPGALLALRGGAASISVPTGRTAAPAPDLDAAVRDAAALLREYLSAVLDSEPEATLQLTGGQDSRILLGAIPPARRRRLRTVTLAVPGSVDVAIAADLARRYGMRHQILRLDGLAELGPEQAHELVVSAARRLECSADPLAWAAVAWAEATAEQHLRLSGLGGEVARGFYYSGHARSVPVTRGRVRRLAQWRMFTNEAVSLDALDPAFTGWARRAAVEELAAIFAGYGPDWLTATDEFYLGQRMHRWAGVLTTATCLERTVVNPMLDDRFLDLARSLHTRDKRGSRFLSRLSCRLDAELSAIPLDGRPAPRVYAYPGLGNRAALAATTARKVGGKVRQRAMRVRRPPAGSEILAGKIAGYYRANPDVLGEIASFGVFRRRWLDAVAAGSTPVDPASAAMLINLEVAARDTRVRQPG